MSERLPWLTSEQLIAARRKAGFEEQRQRGSHLHLRRRSDRKRVTVSVHKGQTVRLGTLHGILHDAGLTVEQLRDLL